MSEQMRGNHSSNNHQNVSNAIIPHSLEAQADTLMDELFAEVEILLDGVRPADDPLPPQEPTNYPAYGSDRAGYGVDWEADWDVEPVSVSPHIPKALPSQGDYSGDPFAGVNSESPKKLPPTSSSPSVHHPSHPWRLPLLVMGSGLVTALLVWGVKGFHQSTPSIAAKSPSSSSQALSPTEQGIDETFRRNLLRSLNRTHQSVDSKTEEKGDLAQAINRLASALESPQTQNAAPVPQSVVPPAPPADALGGNAVQPLPDTPPSDAPPSIDLESYPEPIPQTPPPPPPSQSIPSSQPVAPPPVRPVQVRPQAVRPSTSRSGQPPVPAPTAQASQSQPAEVDTVIPAPPVPPAGAIEENNQAPASSVPRVPSPPPVAIAPPLATNSGNYRLKGVVDLGDRAVALFEHNDGGVRQVNAGSPIGSSGWTLKQVSEQTAIIQRNGQVRSLEVGQQF